MVFVDDHCHLSHEYFSDKLEEVVSRAKSEGVKRIIASGTNKETNKEVISISNDYDVVSASLGLHPTDVEGVVHEGRGLDHSNSSINDELDFIEENSDEVIALGEIGLDYHHIDEEDSSEQKNVFKRLLRIAEDTGKPVVIHSRKAESDCLNILSSFELEDVVLHTFEGSKNLIREAESRGYYFSIPTHIVRSEHFQMLSEMVDSSRWLTETDSPWLSPYRDKKNEPVFVKKVVEKISEVNDMSKEKVENIVFNNFNQVFMGNI